MSNALRACATVCLALLLAGCASGGEPDEQPGMVTLTCPADWADCARQANRLCGSAGFDEIDRFQSERLTSSGRSIRVDSPTQVHPEDNRAEVEGRAMTIRCR